MWQPDLGRRVARSRNNAIRCLRGDLLVFLDGDCVVRSDFLSTHASAHDGERRLLCGSRKFLFARPQDVPMLREPKRLSRLLQRADTAKLFSMRSWQERVAASAPWRACMACNMSVTRSADVWFDEQFTGWGSEDAECAFRLFRHGRYQVAIDPIVDCYTIEYEREEGFKPMRPGSHDAIVDCLRDLLYFQSVHGVEDSQPIMTLCSYFAVDGKSGTWRQVSETEAAERPVDRAVAEAMQWFAAHGRASAFGASV